MGIAVGVFGLTEDAFWAMTPHAFYAALHAHRLANGGKDEEAEWQEFAEQLEKSGAV